MHNGFRELRQKGQETSDGVARPNHSLSNDRRQRNPHDDFGYDKGEQKMPFSQQEDLRRAATGGWHPSAEGLPNTPEHRMRGGVIDGKLDKLTSYLEDHEQKIFKNARTLKHKGMNQKDFPLKERIVYSMYDSIGNYNNSPINYSNQAIYNMLSIKRRSDQYKQAFPEYGQSSQQTMSLQEQMFSMDQGRLLGQSSQQTMSLQEQMFSMDQGRLLGQSSQQTMSLQEQMFSMDQGRLLRTSSPEETGYTSGSDTEPHYDRFSTIDENRKETLKEFAYNLIIIDNKTRLKRVTKNENEFDFVVECLREHLPDWKTTDQHTYREAHQRLLG